MLDALPPPRNRGSVRCAESQCSRASNHGRRCDCHERSMVDLLLPPLESRGETRGSDPGATLAPKHTGVRLLLPPAFPAPTKTSKADRFSASRFRQNPDETSKRTPVSCYRGKQIPVPDQGARENCL